jgi:pyridoxamine 5'-phosphate oxidase
MSPWLCGFSPRARKGGRPLRTFRGQPVACVGLDCGAHRRLDRPGLFEIAEPGQLLGEGTSAKGCRQDDGLGDASEASNAGAQPPLAKERSQRYHSADVMVRGSRIALNGLNSSDFTEAGDPIALFRLWFEEAIRSEVNDPEAMTLSTVDGDGLPDARMVLCKNADAGGLVFYTNAESAKGRELAGQPKAAALFHWKSLRRQARFRGFVTEVTGAESDAYFASRPRGSRIGAWASRQSRPLASRAALEAAVAAYERRFGGGEIPRPDYWRGYRLTPVEIEFWRDGLYRLHDRVVFKRAAVDAPWEKRRLYP